MGISVKPFKMTICDVILILRIIFDWQVPFFAEFRLSDPGGLSLLIDNNYLSLSHTDYGIQKYNSCLS